MAYGNRKIRNTFFGLFLFFVGAVNDGFAITEKTDTTERSFSLVSFNLYNRPVNRSERIVSSAELLKRLDADIIAFQEVSQGWLLGQNPINTIRKSLGYYGEIFYYEDVPPLWQNGLAILSRWPVRVIRNHTFDVNRFFNIKGFQHVVIDSPSGAVDLINLHMAATARHSIKSPEFEQLVKYINSLNSAVIVLGDFNENRDSELIASLSGNLRDMTNMYDVANPGNKSSLGKKYGESCIAPEGKRLDYVFFNNKQYSLLAGEIYDPEIQPPVSDHCLIRTRFKYETTISP